MKKYVFYRNIQMLLATFFVGVVFILPAQARKIASAEETPAASAGPELPNPAEVEEPLEIKLSADKPKARFKAKTKDKKEEAVAKKKSASKDKKKKPKKATKSESNDE